MSQRNPPQKPEECLLSIRLTPKSSRSNLVQDSEGHIKAWVNAPPVDGAANEAACLLIAKALNLGRSKVDIVSGHSHRNKVFKVHGLSYEVAMELIPIEKA